MMLNLCPLFPGDRGAGVSGPDVTPERGGPLEPPTALLATVFQGGRVDPLELQQNFLSCCETCSSKSYQNK